MTTNQLRQNLVKEIYNQIESGTYNTFANIVEVSCGKEKADEFRKLAISDGKWIKMDGVIYNGS